MRNHLPTFCAMNPIPEKTMSHFIVCFSWRLKKPAKFFNSGATMIVVDAVDQRAAKHEARRRFADKSLRFTGVKQFETSPVSDA